MPDWVNQGFNEFARRLPPECSLNLIEVAAGKRTKKAGHGRAMVQEGQRMLAAIPKGARVLALDIGGRAWSTGELADQLRDWMQSGTDVALLVGGADGLDPACLERADGRWSLSRLTFPHQLVRILVSEQIYRAWSITRHHPYHRA